MTKVIVVGTSGHIEQSTSKLIADLTRDKHEVVFCEPEKLGDIFGPEPIVIRNLPRFDTDISCRNISKKSKGDKRRERGERRRKWGI
jgi:hypothetical protein